jgi:uncharacterized C2H2 Zn-finger protein
VLDQIRREEIETIRIHVMGDFYSQEYFDKWVEIARNCPQVKILAYTRNYDIDASNAPGNLVIYYSVDATTVKENPTIKLRAVLFRAEHGKKLYQHMEKFNERERTFVCSSRCEHCKACWSGKIDIAFPIRAGRYQYRLEHEPYVLTRGDWRTRVDKLGNPVLPQQDTEVRAEQITPNVEPTTISSGGSAKPMVVTATPGRGRETVALKHPDGRVIVGAKIIDDVKQCCEIPDIIEVGNERFCSNCGLVQGSIRVEFNGQPTVDNLLKKVMSNEKQKMAKEIGKDRPKITRQSFKKQITKILSIMDNMKHEFAELESLIANVQEKKPRKKKAAVKATHHPNVNLSNDDVSPIQKDDGKGLLTNQEKKPRAIPKAMQYNGDTKCDFCERLFFGDKGKVMHERREHPVEYRRMQQEIKNTVPVIEPGSENVKCLFCERLFINNKAHIMHMLWEHPVEYRALRSAKHAEESKEPPKKTIRHGWENCPQCGVAFRKKRLYMHVIRHHEKRGGRGKKISEQIDQS